VFASLDVAGAQCDSRVALLKSKAMARAHRIGLIRSGSVVGSLWTPLLITPRPPPSRLPRARLPLHRGAAWSRGSFSFLAQRATPPQSDPGPDGPGSYCSSGSGSAGLMAQQEVPSSNLQPPADRPPFVRDTPGFSSGGIENAGSPVLSCSARTTPNGQWLLFCWSFLCSAIT